MSNIKKTAILDAAPPSASYTYELNIGNCGSGDYTISYDFNPGGDPSLAIPCRIQILDLSNPAQTTGFCGSDSYNSQLQALGLDNVSSTNGNGNIVYTKNDPSIESIFLTIDSPLPGSKWSFTLNCPVDCDSDSDVDPTIECAQVMILNGPNLVGCGEEFIGGGTRTMFNCSSVIRVDGPEGDSDYCLNCLSNEVTINTVCVNGGGGDSDSDIDSDSDVALNVLFDKSSWASVGTGSYNTPYQSYLDQAADRWATFVKINPTIVSDIKNNPHPNEPVWNGIKTASNEAAVAAYGPGRFGLEVNNDSASNYAASCGPVITKQDSSTLSIIAINFQLKINDWYSDPSNPNKLEAQEWINVFTHELGHALGIGIFWLGSVQQPNVAIWNAVQVPVDHFLDGNVDSSGNPRSFNLFQNAQKAYNDIVGDQTLTKIPLKESANALSSDNHWNDTFRSSNGVNYPGLFDEIMTFSTLPNMPISRLSIKTLVDFRSFQEINVDAQEASPDTINSQSIVVAKASKVGCGCGH